MGAAASKPGQRAIVAGLGIGAAIVCFRMSRRAIASMPTRDAVFSARARGMVLGNLIGDAAAVPNHWVYDPVKMASHVKAAKRGPAFCDPPGNNFYQSRPGGQSCYGDQTLTLLESLVAKEGFNASDYADRLNERFGHKSEYELAATDPDNWPQLKQNPKDADGNVIEEKRVWKMPLPGPWRHGSIKSFLTNYVTKELGPTASGSDDEQIDGCCKVPPLVALYAGHPDLLPIVEKAVRVTQNTDTAVAFSCGFARILESLLLGTATSVQDACRLASTAISDHSNQFSTPKDADVCAALSLVEDLSSLSPDKVGEKLQEVMKLPRLSSALS